LAKQTTTAFQTRLCSARTLVQTKDTRIRGINNYAFAYCELNKRVNMDLTTTAAANGNQYSGTANQRSLADFHRVRLRGGPGPKWNELTEAEKCPPRGTSEKIGSCFMACKAQYVTDTGNGPEVSIPDSSGNAGSKVILPPHTSVGYNDITTMAAGYCGTAPDEGSIGHVAHISCFTSKGPYVAGSSFDGFTNLQNLGYIGDRADPQGMRYMVPDFNSCITDCDSNLCADYVAGA
jgi:hypothetical protein